MRLLCLPQTFEFKIGLVLGLGLRLGLEITYDEAVVKKVHIFMNLKEADI